MRVWTVHAEPPPAAGADAVAPAPGGVVLVPEGFAWLAFLFGPVWLAWHRLWLWAGLYLLAVVALGLLLPAGVAVPAEFALQFLLGAHGHDLRRRRLARRGLVETGVVAGSDLDSATARLLDHQPGLAARMVAA